MSKPPWRVYVGKPKEISPGFWCVETLTGASHYSSEYVAVVDADGGVVADNAEYYAQPITLEDARLIAAAPDLLKELSNVADWLARPDERALSDSDVANIRAAIAKATGEQP